MKYFICISFFLTALFLTGCAGEKFNYVDNRDLKPGPGLISGESGTIILYGKDASAVDSYAKTKESPVTELQSKSKDPGSQQQ